jgi:hypothetical protein
MENGEVWRMVRERVQNSKKAVKRRPERGSSTVIQFGNSDIRNNCHFELIDKSHRTEGKRCNFSDSFLVVPIYIFLSSVPLNRNDWYQGWMMNGGKGVR